MSEYSRQRSLPIYTFIATLAAYVASLVLGASHSPLVPLPGTIAMLLVPGASLISFLNARPARASSRIVLSVCLSLMVIMVVGGVASLLGPHFGDAHPLNVSSERIIWFALAVVLFVVCIVLRRDPIKLAFEGVDARHFVALLLGGLLVVFSILGVARLNHIGDNNLAVISVSLDILLLLVCIVGGWRRDSRWPLASLLYVATLSLLLSTSLRGAHLYGWDIQQEFGVASGTITKGLWTIPANHDPYGSMLSLTVLPAILHSLVKLRLTAFFELVVPAILALLPVALLSSVSGVPRWVKRRPLRPRPGLALGIIVAFVISSEVFPVELVAISRQAMALTMFAAVIMVILDRTIPVRISRVLIALLAIAISFTHYTTSYLLAAIVLGMWLVGLVWSRGWLVVPKERFIDHRANAKARKVISLSLVVISLIAAFGWNLAVTRNNALKAPTQALVTSGVGLVTKTGSSQIPASELEKLLVRELHATTSWIEPLPGSNSIKLVSSNAPQSPGVAPNFEVWWNRLIVVGHDGLWVLALLALLYGIFFLERRRSKRYTSDLAGLAIAGIVVGIVLRFFGTFSAFYSPERGAIVAAMLLVAPLTILFDDIANRLSRTSLVCGVLATAALAIWASGLGDLFFGGQAPSSIVAHGENDERFIVTTPEFATAIWLRKALGENSFVQTDYLGQLVLLSEPGRYGLVPEMIPPEVDQRAFIYLSTTNLIQDRSRAEVDNGRYIAAYKSNLGFFDKNFYIVYSTGLTRVYHR